MKSRKQIRTQAEKDFAARICNMAGIQDDGIIVVQKEIAAQRVYAVETTAPQEAEALLRACSNDYRLEKLGTRVVLFWPKKVEGNT
jgi:hypothetical protein